MSCDITLAVRSQIEPSAGVQASPDCCSDSRISCADRVRDTFGSCTRWVALAAPLWLAAVLLVACATGAYLAARRPQSQAWR